MKKEKKIKNKKELSSWKSLFVTIKKLHLPWIWIIIGLAINFISNDYLLDLPNTTADLLNGNIEGKALWDAIAYYILFGLIGTLAVVGQVQAQSYGVKKARDSIWKKMLGTKMAYFDKNDPSYFVSTITSDAGSAVLGFINVIIYLLPNMYYVIGVFKRIGEYHWMLAASCLALVPIKFLYSFILGRKYHVHTAALYEKIGTLTSFLSDRIVHLNLIKLYTNEEREIVNGKDASQKLYNANMKLVGLENISTAAISAIDVLQKFVVVIVAVILLRKKEIDVAMWLAFFLYTQNLFSTIDQLFIEWLAIKNVHGTFERVIEVINADEETTSANTPFPKTGDIEFKNVTFTYPGADKPAVDNVSFTAKRGASLAIVGLCGSGKTTSLSFLERLYMPDEGEILIGNKNISEFSLSDFRKNISYVQQGADVFSGTLREALTYGIDRQVSDKEIFEAAEKTGFDEYLQLCNNNLDKELSSGGLSMSGGQSQRLVLTREFLRNGDIILMDEPTSALDVRVSAKIQETTDEIFADKTRILVTHDLSLAKKYEKIIVMENGKIVGEGNHESLLETCSVYQAMNNSVKKEAIV